MIAGSYQITDSAIITHKDSYRLATITTVSVRRPFLPAAVIFGLGGACFLIAFFDLLYLHERVWIAGSMIGFFGFSLACGQIHLLSRDLKGSELSGMLFGTFGHLNRLRRAIDAAKSAQDAQAPQPGGTHPC